MTDINNEDDRRQRNQEAAVDSVRLMSWLNVANLGKYILRLLNLDERYIVKFSSLHNTDLDFQGADVLVTFISPPELDLPRLTALFNDKKRTLTYPDMQIEIARLYLWAQLSPFASNLLEKYQVIWGVGRDLFQTPPKNIEVALHPEGYMMATHCKETIPNFYLLRTNENKPVLILAEAAKKEAKKWLDLIQKRYLDIIHRVYNTLDKRGQFDMTDELGCPDGIRIICKRETDVKSAKFGDVFKEDLPVCKFLIYITPQKVLVEGRDFVVCVDSPDQTV